MVKIEPPPPTRRANPSFLSLPIRTELLRIYTPGEKWKNTPISFRRMNGAIERFDHHLSQIDVSRGIHYSAESLRGCLVEIFGDDGILCCGTRRLGFIHTTSPLKLLDLRAEGAWRAGSVAAICTCTERVEPQKWSAFFYEEHLDVHGLAYHNAHNGDTSYALYERAEWALECLDEMELGDPRLRTRLLDAADELNLDFFEE